MIRAWAMSARGESTVSYRRGVVVAVACLTAALVAAGCGGGGRVTRKPPSVSAGRPLVASCKEPSADPRLVADRGQPDAVDAGALVIYADIKRQIPDDVVQAPKAVVIPQGPRAVVLRVAPSARSRFRLLFGGAGTGMTKSGFRVVDGVPAVRFPACGGPVGFRGAFVFKGAQCVPIEVQAAGERMRRFSLAVGRAPATCPNAAPVRALAEPGAAPTRIRSRPMAGTRRVPSAVALQRALINGVTPMIDRPTSASCRSATSAERSRSGFGARTRQPVFSCELDVRGERGSYAVEVVPDGCFVAERVQRGRALFGCGVPMTQVLRFAHAPYMGVACHVPNSIACDRVGLAVWLRQPAAKVSAAIGSRRFTLGDRVASRAGRRRIWMFSGFLQPAGMRDKAPLHVNVDVGPDTWYGRNPVAARVRITARLRDGGQAAATVRVPLRAGWG